MAPRPNLILGVLLLAGVSFALAQTMVVPALPAIAEDVGAEPSSASWLLTGYLLAASVATPIVGKLGDLFGKGRVLTAVLTLFALGAALCAVADSIGLMIAGRVVQGVAGGVFPLSFGIIRDTFPPERVPIAISAISAVFGIGGGIGLPLSGVVVDHLDLSVLFLLGLMALPAAVLAWLVVPPSPPRERTRVDLVGAALLSGALVLVLLAVTDANDHGWTSTRTLGMIAGGLALFAVWIAVESRVRDPLVDLRVLRRRAVATTNVAAFLVGFAMFAAFLLMPQFAQAPESTGYGWDMSVLESGLLLLPSAAVQLVAGPVAGRLGSRYGFRVTLIAGTALGTVSFVILMLAHSHPWHFLVAGAFLGAGIAFAFASMANLIVAAVPQQDVGIASGLNTIMRTVGGASGAAVAVAILTSDTLRGLPTEHAYTVAFATASAGGVLAILAASFVPGRRAGGGGAVAPAPAAG